MKRGVSFFSLLGLLFIGLKLGGAIAWSWWWVLLPLYGPTALVVLLFAVIGCYAVFTDIKPWRRPRA